MIISQLLESELQTIPKHFSENELAYLALTSKIEMPIRDKVAFNLQEKLKPDNIVSREWKRCDLAILKEQLPVALIEFKAMYHFDVILNKKRLNEFEIAIDGDIEKSRRIAKTNTKIFEVLLSTNPKRKIPKRFKDIIKYQNGINRKMKKNKSSEEIDAFVNNKVKDWYPNVEIQSDIIDCGESFGIETDLRYWVIGPFN